MNSLAFVSCSSETFPSSAVPSVAVKGQHLADPHLEFDFSVPDSQFAMAAHLQSFDKSILHPIDTC